MDLSFQPKMLLFSFVVCQQQNLRMEITSLLLAHAEVFASAVKRSIGSPTGCTITEKAPTRAFSWLKAPTSAFTFKTLLRHSAKQALTPW